MTGAAATVNAIKAIHSEGLINGRCRNTTQKLPLREGVTGSQRLRLTGVALVSFVFLLRRHSLQWRLS